VALGGAAFAIALTSSHNQTAIAPSTTAHVASKHSISNSTTASSTTPSTQASAQGQAAALSGLLTQSANDRAAIDAATQSITNCGNIQSADTTLDASASSRQSLLNQLQGLKLTALPSGTQLTGFLTAAWTNSEASDKSYAAWAADEISNGCTPGDTSDLNFQNAQVTDAQSTSNKTSFANLWNTIAPTYNLPTVLQQNL
jgi:hypothetical protein